MAEDIITILGGIGRKEGMPKGIKFQNVHYKSIFSDLYTNEAGRDEDDSCRSDNDQKYTDKVKREEDVKILADDIKLMMMNFDDIGDICEDSDLLPNSKLANEKK